MAAMGGVPPVQAESTATPNVQQPDTTRKVETHAPSFVQEAGEFLGKVKDFDRGIEADVGTGLLSAGVHAARAVGKAVDAVSGTDLANALLPKEAQQKTAEQTVEGILPSDKTIESLSPTTSPFHQAVRGITEFATLTALTGDVGELSEGPRILKAGAQALKMTTIQQMSESPRTSDMLTSLAKSGTVLDRLGLHALAANPTDPEWAAQLKQFSRNLISNAAFSAVATGAAAFFMQRVPELAGKIKLPEMEPDVASIEQTPDGKFNVRPLTPSGTIDFEGHAQDLENAPSLATQQQQAAEQEADRRFAARSTNKGTNVPEEGTTGGATFEHRGDAEIEVAAQNERAQNEKAKAPDEEFQAKNQATFDEINRVIQKGAHPRAIQQIIEKHGLAVPYGADETQTVNWVRGLAETLKMPPASRMKDTELMMKASALGDPEADGPEMVQRFKQWFGQDTGPEHILAARIYLRSLGNQAAKLGEAMTTGAEESPTARENMQQMWQTMMQVYVPFRGALTRAGRASSRCEPPSHVCRDRRWRGSGSRSASGRSRPIG